MNAISIRNIFPKDKTWIQTLALESWGNEKVVVCGRVFDLTVLAGVVAEINGERSGLATYIIDGATCEVITLNSLQSGLGVGSQLLDAVAQRAGEQKCKLLTLFTTNDNINALRFYQKYGFHLAALIPNGVEADRKIKPELPQRGENGIPIRDYLELRMELKA
jgi:GNAT superfamily N-acetyltransferase